MTSLPRGAVKAAAEAILAAQNANDGAAERFEAKALATAALTAALEVIQRDAVRQAARRIVLLDALANGRACPACHGKPATTPHMREGRTGYTCSCGHAWEPPKFPDYGMRTESVIKRLARGEPLPDLPAKEGSDEGRGTIEEFSTSGIIKGESG